MVLDGQLLCLAVDQRPNSYGMRGTLPESSCDPAAITIPILAQSLIMICQINRWRAEQSRAERPFPFFCVCVFSIPGWNRVSDSSLLFFSNSFLSAAARVKRSAYWFYPFCFSSLIFTHELIAAAQTPPSTPPSLHPPSLHPPHLQLVLRARQL